MAGLSAGCALAEAGFEVTLLERRPYIGGRASSYQHPGTGEVVDNCQHVLLGCCTNLLNLYDRFGAADKIRWFDSLTFVEPGGRQSVIRPSGLPAPFHTAPSFLAASSLELVDKFAISRAMLALMAGLPEDTTEDFLSWLKRHGQTERAIDRFWKVVLVSALNEELDRTSVRYAAQVFRESFMKSAAAGRMGVPTVPLTDLYSAGTEYITERGGSVRLRASVDYIEIQADRVKVVSGTETFLSDYVVLAVPYHTLGKILPAGEISQPLAQQLNKFESSPITGIHLWFDRQITELEHAVLLDRTIQWMFHKSKLLSKHRENGNNLKAEQGSYVELVVSSSKTLVDTPRQEIIELSLKELAEFFPAVKQAKLVKSAVIKEIFATYSALPQSDLYRPNSVTAWPRIFLAGDWTATGWPATMEGAVRSGYRAAEALTQSLQLPDKFIVPDLAASGFMRLFK
ncbi:MAG: Carotene 7,8-desaturase [Acidobacteriales bacterium]|nr:Carotene 7,8-desaturase [Terriglobales bacterium]